MCRGTQWEVMPGEAASEEKTRGRGWRTEGDSVTGIIMRLETGGQGGQGYGGVLSSCSLGRFEAP